DCIRRFHVTGVQTCALPIYLNLFDDEHEVAPGVTVARTGGHTPGHSVVHVASRDDRLTFVGDAIFPVGFEHPDWQNGFEHDPDRSEERRVGEWRGHGRPVEE